MVTAVARFGIMVVCMCAAVLINMIACSSDRRPDCLAGGQDGKCRPGEWVRSDIRADDLIVMEGNCRKVFPRAKPICVVPGSVLFQLNKEAKLEGVGPIEVQLVAHTLEDVSAVLIGKTSALVDGKGYTVELQKGYSVRCEGDKVVGGCALVVKTGSGEEYLIVMEYLLRKEGEAEQHGRYSGASWWHGPIIRSRCKA